MLPKIGDKVKVTTPHNNSGLYTGLVFTVEAYHHSRYGKVTGLDRPEASDNENCILGFYLKSTKWSGWWEKYHFKITEKKTYTYKEIFNILKPEVVK